MQQVNSKETTKDYRSDSKIEEREWFKLYTLVHIVQVAYTREFTEQKERIHMHALSRKEKRVWDGKLKVMNTRGSYHGINPW